jgi:hypothetical protein
MLLIIFAQLIFNRTSRPSQGLCNVRSCTLKTMMTIIQRRINKYTMHGWINDRLMLWLLTWVFLTARLSLFHCHISVIWTMWRSVHIIKDKISSTLKVRLERHYWYVCMFVVFLVPSIWMLSVLHQDEIIMPWPRHYHFVYI